MLRRIAVVVSVGLADSVNPSTVGPALYMATVRRRRVGRIAQFAAGVFVVTLAGGLVLMIGPGRLLLDLVPRPHGTARHLIELAAGIALLIGAVVLWLSRRPLARRKLPAGGGGGSAWLAGASIGAVELPTAAPYFAVIAGIVASPASLPEEILLVLLYNLAFVAPLLAIIVVLLVAGDTADPWLARGGAWLQRRWPVVLASLLMLVGGILTVLGGAGLLAL
ncbi:MAG TPA: GAP family protein [Solirubrobacteraceae bacterium]|nr:GAP family protein [Solirubrobacteraceae bacterium]